nr:DUF3261 domain-containing protein [Escherichia coli]
MSQSICSTGLRWLWLVVVVLIIDLGSKYLILQNFALGDTVPLFPSLNLHYARNYGAAFSFLAEGLRAEQSIVVPQLPPASQVLADVMLSHWPISAWQPQLPAGWTLRDNGDKRELRNASGKLVTEITYLNRKGKRVPISIEQHVFKYHITIQYLGD